MPRASERLARAYLALQALAVAAWWVALYARPPLRALFRPPAAPDATLLAFAPGDLLLALGSALAAASPARPARSIAAWLVAGAMSYAAAYTVVLAVTCAAGWLGAILMAPAALGSLAAAWALKDAHARPIPDRRRG